MILFKRLLATGLFLSAYLGISEPLSAMKRKDFLSRTKENSCIGKEPENFHDLCTLCLGSLSESGETNKPEGITLNKKKKDAITLPCGHKLHLSCMLDDIEHGCVLCPTCKDARAGFFAYNSCEYVLAEKRIQLRDRYAQTLLNELSKSKSIDACIVRNIINTTGEHLTQPDFFEFMNAEDKEGRTAIVLARQYDDPNIDEDNIETILTDATEKYLGILPEMQEEKCLLCKNPLTQEGAPCDLQLLSNAPGTFALNCSAPFEEASKHEFHTSCLVNKITDMNGDFKDESACELCKRTLPTRDAYNQLIGYCKDQNHPPLYTVYPALLLQAAKKNNLNAIKELFDENQQTNLTNAQFFQEFLMAQGLGGKTTLDWACEHKNIEMLTFFLNIRTNTGLSPLLYAARDKKMDIMEKLIETAKKFGQQSIVELLKQQSPAGTTALMYAIQNDNSEGTKLILDAITTTAPEQIIDLLKLQNLDNATTLIYAAQNENPEETKLILDAINTTAPEQIIDLLKHQDRYGMTALMYAVNNNNPEKVKLMLDAITAPPEQIINLLALQSNYLWTALKLAKSEEVRIILLNAQAKAEAALEALGQ